MKAGIGLVLMIIAGCAGPQLDNTAEDVVDRPGKDQALVIQLAANGCVEEVLPPIDDNCRDPGETERAGCRGIKDCACAARDKNISWQVALPPSNIPPGGGTPSQPDFTILFKGTTTPFLDNCKLEAKAGGSISCRISLRASGDYEYGIKVSSCTELYDPRIVIRNFLY